MSRARDTADQINRVNSSAADATAITVDSSENIMIGTTVTGRASEGADRLTIADASHSGMTIRSGENAYCSINFSDSEGGAGEYAGQIWYGHGSLGEKLVMAVQGSNKVTVDGDGLKFNNDTAAANALSDYEEGTFTPTVIFGSGSSGITYSVREGKYTKIGNTVQYYIQCSLSSKGSSTGNLSITGLPFTNTDTASPPSILTGSFTNTSDIQIYLNSGGATLNLENRNTGTQSPLSNSNVNNNSTMFIAGVYRTSQ